MSERKESGVEGGGRFWPAKRQLVLVLWSPAPEPISGVSEQTSMLVATPIAFPLCSQGFGGGCMKEFSSHA